MNSIIVSWDPADDSNALVAWTLPFNNYETISELEINFLQKDGSFSGHSSCAPASTDISCIIPISSFLSSPYLLIQGDLIQGRIWAKNVRGTGIYSPLNSNG